MQRSVIFMGVLRAALSREEDMYGRSVWFGTTTEIAASGER
jgi:hypothetical protein